MTLRCFWKCQCVDRRKPALRQKGVAVTGVFPRTLTIQASVTDLQPLVMCTANGQSSIALGGDARIKFVLPTVLLDLTSGARQRYSSDSQTMGGTSVIVLIWREASWLPVIYNALVMCVHNMRSWTIVLLWQAFFNESVIRTFLLTTYLLGACH
jgi:hypothetical protein